MKLCSPGASSALVTRAAWSPNIYSADRREISAVVLHYTGSMSLQGAVAWFLNPFSQVSAHYVIDRDGEIVQMVREQDIAWHAGRGATLDGRTSVNSFSIGIELVGTDGSGFPGQQLAALYALLGEIVTRYQIPAARVVGHHDVMPAKKIDPDGSGHQFPWTECRAVVTAALAKEK